MLSLSHKDVDMAKHQAFSTGQVAKILGSSVEAVNYWIRQGKLPAFRTPGGHYRVDSVDLTAFQAKTGSWVDPEYREELHLVPKILVVDDEPYMRDLIKDLLDDEYDVSLADGGLEGCLFFGDLRPDILIVDVRMPDISGLEVVRAIKRKHAHPVKVIVVTGYPYDPHAEELKLMEIDGFLAKPFNIDELRRLVYSLDDDREPRRFLPSGVQ
jgi:excisionase family DNA binding protein